MTYRSGDWKYLTYVKQLSKNWPHLELLADFMMVGTMPMRWIPNALGSYPDDWDEKLEARQDRMARTNVTILEYADDALAPAREDCRTSSALREHIAHLDKTANTNTKFRLFVVEDLSSDVIEILGARYDVNPLFFREHLCDNIWYNIRDWWRDPPNLDLVSKNQNWFQMRFQRARYFKSKEHMNTGERQVSNFNVHRQLQGDRNTSLRWDTYHDDDGTKRAPKIGQIRSRATFWIKRPDATRDSSNDQVNGNTEQQQQQGEQGDNPKKLEPTIGILLLDPTIKAGHPLWRQYRNWNRVPSMAEVPPPAESRPPQAHESSFFEDFIYWASRPDAFDQGPYHEHSSSNSSEPSVACLPTQALLHIICNEWLTLVDYIKTRLNQIDWEIADPDSFLTKDEQIETALHKLHLWRRVVPVYRAMLAETFLRVFREAKHPDRMHPGRHEGVKDFHADANLLSTIREGDGRHASLDLSVQERRGSIIVGGGGGQRADHQRPGSALHDLLGRECIKAYRHDYTLVLNYMEEFQARIDRLTEVVTAVITIQDSRRGYKDNKNLQWLTWLATFFIPLSFVATMLSMTTGPLTQLHDAVVMWAEISVPSGLLIMSLVLLMSIAKARRGIRKFFKQHLPWFGKQSKDD
ncbi:hypothetical protein M406DRAFT_353282 [Cryphonectria parasitica EP155]|uniref:Uncharacterized protein n=1 Tax=Cryphonectria parasitica (strain ATCC 38755 / EP155) TaxID=660469 RepID=A0A9P4XVZ3_CRYP1|nr:uncharacterized protein M406DRAFT_353282 [Cryphonectria parasitica EP155]KAF3761832.1 hypothetical protein M406DRAFT_353282 [Cryphonectria parasitica EP155]